MKKFDVVIVGAGPAGMAAAVVARRSTPTLSVGVIDDNHSAGGQIWRGGGPFPIFAESGAHFMAGARVIDGSAPLRQLTVESAGEVCRIQYSKLILATGAREVFLPFPGWTLPNVFGVGGLQALAKSGLPVRGKRVVVGGSGPLLLAVAAYLKEHGAEVPLIAEQASWGSLLSFGTAMLQQPSKIRQAVRLKMSLPGVKYLSNCWVTQAMGKDRVEAVTLSHKGNLIHERCDYLAVAYGFAPNTELAQLLGCKLNAAGLVLVNARQQTSVDDIYCAGEPTGLGGVDRSVFEGEVAGLAIEGKSRKSGRRSATHFSSALDRAFALRSEMRTLVKPETIVCRCEDVPYERLQKARSWREAKLHFRCGMGPCQGRVCGPAVQYLFGWRHESVRPPIFPTTVQNLISIEEPIQL